MISEPLQCSQGGIPYNKVHLDAKDAEIERLQDAKRRALAIADERAKENVELRAALNDIANPLQGIERRAKVQGCVVNYPMAQGLAEQASYLRALARDALVVCEQKEPQTPPGAT